MKRFGITRGVSPREPLVQVGEMAKEIEDLGFDMLWFVDHQLGMKDIYAAMNMSALATKRLEIGSAVTNLQTRHPTVTAKSSGPVGARGSKARTGRDRIGYRSTLRIQFAITSQTT